jgi:putative transcriptional regulator
MPITVSLDVVLAQRKMQLNTVAELVGIAAQNLSVLKTGKAKAIRFSTLEKLCGVLHVNPAICWLSRMPGNRPGRFPHEVSQRQPAGRSSRCRLTGGNVIDAVPRTEVAGSAGR